MVQKLFIVATGNDGAYGSLRRGLAGEPNVTVMYDRRRGVARIVSGNERRRRTEVAEQLRTRGWAVVRISA